MSDVFIGQKGEYDWTLNLKTSLIYLPKYDAVLVTRFFILNFQGERLENEFMIALFHECIHQAICKSIGETESKAFDKDPNLNMEIENWLGWHRY
jgi:hypothetical protein